MGWGCVMKYHQAADGTWMRCRAEVRAGRGVTACPVGDGPHVIGRAGIAALPNGGKEARWEDGERVVATISPIDAESGTFTVTSHKRKVRVYTASGAHLPYRQRVKEGASREDT